MTVGSQPIRRGKRGRGSDGARRGALACAAMTRSWMRDAWSAILIAVLGAFLWQSFVTQTHQHFDRSDVSVSTSSQVVDARSAPSNRDTPADLPSNCPICRVIADAGHATLSDRVAIDTPVPATLWLAAVTATAHSVSQTSHSWQSRAPPNSLRT